MRTLAATAVVGRRSRRPRQAQQTVKIGLLATLEGPFAAGGQDGMRGAELAVKQRNGMAGGKKIEIIKASSDAKPDVAVNATRKLVEQDKVDIMVGPLSGSEGIAVKDYSKTQPNITFINGSSGAQAHDAGQSVAELLPLQHRRRAVDGRASARPRYDKGYKKMALIAEDYAFPYSQVQGFMAEYCKLGGKVHAQGVGAARRQGLLLGDRQACRRTSTRWWSCWAAPTR